MVKKILENMNFKIIHYISNLFVFCLKLSLGYIGSNIILLKVHKEKHYYEYYTIRN